MVDQLHDERTYGLVMPFSTLVRHGSVLPVSKRGVRCMTIFPICLRSTLHVLPPEICFNFLDVRGQILPRQLRSTSSVRTLAR